MTEALILVDIQNDFLPGGALAVPNGEEVIEVANRLQPQFDWVVATQDWHPQNHGSFADNHPGRRPGEIVELAGLQQVLWPAHCIQNEWGSQFAAELEMHRVTKVVQKGVDPTVDSYSGFFDNGRRRATELDDYLRSLGVTAVSVLGLATDYCVRFTALDACSLGYRTRLLLEGCRGVELETGDCAAAIREMAAAGVEICDRVAAP